MEKQMGERDFYKHIKEKSNSMALSLYPKLKEKVHNSKDKLLTAVEIAIAGNVIDYAAKNTLNIEKEIEKLFREDFSDIGRTIFDYESFKEELDKAKQVLYDAKMALRNRYLKIVEYLTRHMIGTTKILLMDKEKFKKRRLPLIN